MRKQQDDRAVIDVSSRPAMTSSAMRAWKFLAAGVHFCLSRSSHE